MEDLGKSLEKLIKAGIGAVSEGISRTQDMVDKLSEKGEPLYNQACDTVSETAEKIKKSVKSTLECRETVDDIKHSLAKLARSQLYEVAAFVRELLETADGEKASGCCADKDDSECRADCDDDECCSEECADGADMAGDGERPADEETEHVKAKDSHPDDDIFGNG